MQRHRTVRAGSSFAARFGRVILGHGIAPLPSALYHFQGRLGLSAQQVWFISYILTHKWDADLPYPSLKKMAERTGLSLRQVQRIKASLCDMGYLQVGSQYGNNGGQDANTYDFAPLFAALETLLAAGPAPANPVRAADAPADDDELADTSFVARYGRVIARHGVAAVPRALFTHQAALHLTPQQVWFAAYIFSFQWDTGLPYPSLRRMAEATGYSTVQLHTIKAELTTAGYLHIVHRRGEDGGQEANAYDFSGLLEAITTLLRQEAPPAPAATPAPGPVLPVGTRRGRRGVRPAGDDPQLAGGDDPQLAGGNGRPNGAGDDRDLPGRSDIRLTRGGDVQLTRGSDGELAGQHDTRLSRGDGSQLSPQFNPVAGAGMTPGYRRGVTRSYPNIEAGHAESLNQEDSNPHTPGQEGDTKAARPPYSPYIAAMILDFSRELGDSTHAASNVTQALRLHTQGTRSDEEFATLLNEARRRTRLAQGRQGLGQVENKMAYFFCVLHDLAGA